MSIIPTSSSQQLFLISLPDKFPLGQARDQLFVQARNRGPLLNHYVWNMHTLADYCASAARYSVSDSKIITNDDPYWKLLLAETFTNNQGSDSISGTDTFNPLFSFTHYNNNNFRSKIDLKFSPMLSYGVPTDITDSNLILYKAMILPSYPLILTTSIPYNEHYGPVFPTRFTIDVSDSTLKSVSIAAALEGGKSIFAYTKPQINLIEKAIPQSDELGFIPYRTLNIFDCHVDFKTYANKEEFLEKSKIKSQQTSPEYLKRISGMSLSIISEYDFTSVAVNNNRVIFQGPRYATLRRRTVSGSIVYTSNTASFNLPVSSELTMYFGDIFYFPMQNVDWQKPVIQMTAGNNYTHTFNFIARVVDGAVTNCYRNDGYCSEFLVNIR